MNVRWFEKYALSIALILVVIYVADIAYIIDDFYRLRILKELFILVVIALASIGVAIAKVKLKTHNAQSILQYTKFVFVGINVILIGLIVLTYRQSSDAWLTNFVLAIVLVVMLFVSYAYEYVMAEGLKFRFAFIEQFVLIFMRVGLVITAITVAYYGSILFVLIIVGGTV